MRMSNSKKSEEIEISATIVSADRYRHLIALVGMPGSGKSTIGRTLARRLQVPFHDSDMAIERMIGGTISQYFKRNGESAFRSIEEKVVIDLAGTAHGVLATGGGSILSVATRCCLHESATVIYLHASPQQLYRRLRHDTRRPLLQVPDPRARLQELYDQRDPLYRECAHFVMQGHRASRSVMVSRIVAQLELNTGSPE